MRHNKVSRDANHVEIVNDLRKRAYKVVDLAAVGNSIPDIIVADAFVTALIEIKMPKSNVYISQLEFLARWPNVAGFAQTTDDVLAIMSDPAGHALSYEEKQIILMICAEYRTKTVDLKPRIRIDTFEKIYHDICERKGIPDRRVVKD